eukprot:494946-Pleurochrysis_carterae.AAC.1
MQKELRDQASDPLPEGGRVASDAAEMVKRIKQEEEERWSQAVTSETAGQQRGRFQPTAATAGSAPKHITGTAWTEAAIRTERLQSAAQHAVRATQDC